LKEKEEMRRLTLKELQKIELDILIAFDKVCRENNIKYSMGGGSMIGTVRHKGFIPWDDDIDIFMHREEYEKFKKFVSENSFMLDGRYKVLLPGDEGYPYPFMKIIDTSTLLYEKNTVRNKLGVWMDVFQIDYCAHDSREARKMAKSQKRLFVNYIRGRYRCDNDSAYHILKNLFWLPFFRVQTNHIKNKLLAREKQFSQNRKMEYAGTLIWAVSLNDVYPSEYFEEYTEMEFEKHPVMIFKRYNDILTQRYGNYMELPPENERITHDPEAYEI